MHHSADSHKAPPLFPLVNFHWNHVSPSPDEPLKLAISESFVWNCGCTTKALKSIATSLTEIEGNFHGEVRENVLLSQPTFAVHSHSGKLSISEFVCDLVLVGTHMTLW